MKVPAGISAFIIGALLCAAACSSGPKVIPRSKMEKIYVEMLVGDQWLMRDQDDGWKADTTLFYESIFQKYGYTTEDFKASYEYYLRDPLRFSRMMRNVALTLDAKARKKNIEIAASEGAPTDNNDQTTE